MVLARDFEEFIGLLNKHGVEYLVVGATRLLPTGDHAIPVIWISE